MLGYSLSAGKGRIFAGENDQLWIPRSPRAGRCGVIFLHGSGAPDGFIDLAAQASSHKLASMLAYAGIPCVSGAMAYQAWANDPLMSRIDAAWALLATKAPIRTDKVAIVGGSMGGAGGARYSQLHPEKVAANVGLIPLLDLVAFYESQTAPVRTEIGTAWGITPPSALPSSANIAANANLAANVPYKAWYAGDDTITLPAWVTSYVAAVGGEAVNVGNTGHSDASVGAAPVADIAAFLVANGC